VYEIPDAAYIPLLQNALDGQGDFMLQGAEEMNVVQEYLACRETIV